MFTLSAEGWAWNGVLTRLCVGRLRRKRRRAREPRRPKRPYLVPGALETSEIEAVVKAFEWAAKNDQAAGFDGVELHGASVCLLHQSRQDGSNQRNDEYRGSLNNRERLIARGLNRYSNYAAVVDFLLSSASGTRPGLGDPLHWGAYVAA